MMQNNMIQKIAVLGAGVMGAQIAAHFANAGFRVVLFDLPSQKGDPNALIKSALQGLKALSPSPLAFENTLQVIETANYEQDLNVLSTCDLVIEAISERMDWKKSLFDKIVPHLHAKAILATNTSGLSIQTLAEHLPVAIQARFVGMHFFNPPRYMRLVELIAHANSSSALVDHLETFLVSYLGKGVVRAKDSPNFIGNRIGVFALLSVIQHAEHYDIPPDVVDILTGTLVGRPKSGTFRTLDVVGLDTMAYVVNTMKQGLTQDPWSHRLCLSPWLEKLIHKGHLGQKTKQGVYLKKGKDILVFDHKDGTYRTSKPQIAAEIQDIFKKSSPNSPDSPHWLIALKNNAHPQAQFLWSTFRDLFHYSAYHLADIGDTVSDIDLAMCWGYGWAQGPFEIWQTAGWSTIAEAFDSAIATPAWVKQYPEGPYSKKGSEKRALSPASASYKGPSTLKVYEKQIFPERVLFETEAVRLCATAQFPEISVLSFKTKKNTISEAVLDGIQEAIKQSEVDCKAMVIWQGVDQPFSFGANLKDVLQAIHLNRFEAIQNIVAKFQSTALKMRYAKIPVVTAVQGLALGGGCELAMHGARIVAALETYMGLVEVGVGILPAGGGSKEFAYRAAAAAKGKSVEPFITRYFEFIMKAEVSTSAKDALQKDYLRATDVIIMNSAELLHTALSEARHLSQSAYLPPLVLPFAVAGRDVQANFQTHLVNLREGDFISDHDYLIGTSVAAILTGGGVAEGTLVTESMLLEKELEMFMGLIKTKLTQQRIQHLLETGKPLRN